MSDVPNAGDVWLPTHFTSLDSVLGFVCKGPSTARVAASNVGTFTGIATANDTITINGRAYIALADPSATLDAFDVGTTATEQAEALVKTINASGVEGTDYLANQQRNEDVSAANVAGVVTFTARQPGAAGNLITLTESCDNYTQATASVLAGGIGPGLNAPKAIYTYAGVNVATETVTIDGIVYTHRAVPGAEAYAVDVGASAAEAARNLAAAINASGTAGWFGTATVAHPTVFAVLDGATVNIHPRVYGPRMYDMVLSETDTNGSWGSILASGTSDPANVEFQLNANGTMVAEGTNNGNLGIMCNFPSMILEVTVIGVHPTI
jgi:hypothetical protein